MANGEEGAMTLPVNGPLSEIRLARLVEIKVEGVTWAFGESLANLSDSHSKQQPGGSSLDLLWEYPYSSAKTGIFSASDEQ